MMSRDKEVLLAATALGLAVIGCGSSGRYCPLASPNRLYPKRWLPNQRRG